MENALGSILPQAIGVTISPVPIIAVKHSAFIGCVFAPQVVYYKQRYVNFRTQQQKLEESYDYHNQSI